MTRLKEKYIKEIAPKLKEEFHVANIMAVPKITKVVLSVGMGDAKDNQAILDKVVENLTALSGQKPAVTRAKKSISTFKLAKGNQIGAMVTLRGNRMYEFLDKLMSVVLPKVRDFRGISDTSFDNQGNFTLGMNEQALFPEISFQSGAIGSKIRGLGISIVTTAKSREEGKRMLELLGMPFKKEVSR
ncbi:50S ribosomal protein L5 [Candidatus Daviesbacteria bacterium RIFCSPLOWO2_01_FULL_43_38]|uniref:Large ribosomal subunit protein uL5 n=3 Tax=Candidatus Daviesiibacteriota TaxID=1752718 RepID=A0A1F5K858_9BACT|nr:MAG: 50S ribosomal protein L5 [Candidatus Daviesbacteria bacterium GW2011_GWA1_42_6]KKS71324.1 MAG: 50S ribosomal protein L5 [Candidatus Daviesbacteria bacterium GW2011_GWA2_42_7]OGE20409.1 MAG: 50S ribosomal protein L5 [Candidatus Daviesbacteria bacterium RIFCSPHIGHO2_01_FULL_43_17]OGE37015.1 MAG: 50S ribosomal protein L5 [Candidatus Daviesbacteria bacterium RIFCSPHIGHO2_12_FULL_43_11]OGE63917.1 MAG: 50S ribosomal protein L5 [Candidatus Daviesbacteria bacterium RIFCSPLOWO2_01_FULL_43_38]OG